MTDQERTLEKREAARRALSRHTTMSAAQIEQEVAEMFPMPKRRAIITTIRVDTPSESWLYEYRIADGTPTGRMVARVKGGNAWRLVDENHHTHNAIGSNRWYENVNPDLLEMAARLRRNPIEQVEIDTYVPDELRQFATEKGERDA